MPGQEFFELPSFMKHKFRNTPQTKNRNKYLLLFMAIIQKVTWLYIPMYNIKRMNSSKSK